MTKGSTTAVAGFAAMRDFAEDVIDQSEDGLHDATMALRQSIVHLEQQLTLVRRQSSAIAQSSVDCVEKNLEVTLKFAHRLLHASSVEELMQVQADFINTQRDMAVHAVKALGQAAASGAVAVAES